MATPGLVASRIAITPSPISRSLTKDVAEASTPPSTSPTEEVQLRISSAELRRKWKGYGADRYRRSMPDAS